MPLSQFSRLISTGSALPSRCVTNDELARELASLGVETSDEWIRSRTGIETRYLVSGEEGTLSLAVGASRAALEGSAIDPATIDLVIVATTRSGFRPARRLISRRSAPGSLTRSRSRTR